MQGQNKTTYHQQVTYCGKSRCRKCREGIGHGPYWYAYQIVNGQTTRTYIGKHLPPEVLATMEVEPANTGEPAMPGNISTSTPVVDAPLLRAFTLGQFRLERSSHSSNTSEQGETQRPVQWQVVTEAAWQQRQDSQVRTLLGYLLCSPQRRADRTQLQTALWPALDNENATRRLNKTIQLLQRVLGHGSAFVDDKTNGQAGWLTNNPLKIDGDWLILAGQDTLWADADTFEEMLQAATSAETELDTSSTPSDIPDTVPAQHNLPQQREQLLQTALALYNGDFLPEEREAEWVQPRRLYLRHTWIAATLELTDLYINRNANADAVKILDRLLAKDPANEAAVQRLMIVLARSTRRIEALRAYQRFENILRNEYHAEPSQKTLDLCEALRQGTELTDLDQSLGIITKTPAQPARRPAPRPRSSSTSTPGPQKSEHAQVPAAHNTSTHLLPATNININIQNTPLFATNVPAETIGRTHQGPLIGREQEMQTLRALLQKVEQGVRLQLVNQRRVSGIPLDTQRYPQCLLLMGEAGIGKTRLAEEMSREVIKDGWTVVWSRLYPQESSIPYRLWIDALRKILDLSADILPTLDPELLRPLTTLLPEIAELLPRAIRDQALFNPVLDATSLKDAICNLLKTISEQTPLLIVLDDIQWADTDSQFLLSFLARLVYGYPIVFLGTCRDTEIPKNPSHPLRNIIAHMQREHAIKTLDIAPLTNEQIGTLVQHVSQLPATMIQNIQEKAAGNPYFAEELARATPPTLPNTVKAALEHRIRRLSRDCQQLLRNAAVLGGTFEFSFICAMEANSSTLEDDDMADEDTVLTLLEEALLAGVLTDEGTGTRILYHFWHPLLVDSLYESVSGLRRARLHLKAADVLQHMNRGREEEVAATIVDHLIRGEADPARIAHYSELAGNRAYSIFAYNDAARHYRSAVKYLLQANQQQYQDRLLFLQEQIAECTSIQGNYAEARDLYEHILDLRRQQQNQNTAHNEAEQQQDAQIQALLLIELGLNWRYTGDKGRAWQCCSQSEQILQQANINTGHAWSRLYYLQSNLYRLDGRFDEALAASQKALELFVYQLQLEPEQKTTRPATLQTHRPSSGRNGNHTNGSAIIASPTGRTLIQRTLEGNLINLGRIHRQIGTVAESRGQLTMALEHQSKALSVFQQYDDKRQIAHVSCNIGYIHLKKAEYDQAREALLRSFDLADRIGDTPLIALLISNLGELAAATGDLTEAERLYRDALSRAESTEDQDREYICRWSIGLGEVLQRHNKFNEAVHYLCRAWQIARELRSQPCIGLALVALGNLRMAQAEALSGEATPTAQQQQRLLQHAETNLQRALLLEHLERETHTRALLALARVALQQRRTQQAASLLAQVCAEAYHYELIQIAEQARKLQES